MASTRTAKRPWTRGEKAILWSSVAALVIGIGWGLWLNAMNADPVVHIPTPAMPSPNAFDGLVAASSNTVEGWPMPGNRPPLANPRANMAQPVKDPDLADPKIMAAAEALLQQNQTALQAVRQSFAYSYLSPPVRSFSQPLSYFARFRSVARIAAFQAKVDAQRRDYDGAVNSALLAIRVGNDVPRGGGIIHQLVGYACEAIGRKPLWNNLDALNADQCRRLCAALETLDRTRYAFEDTLINEKWSGAAALEEIFRTSNWKSSLVDGAGQNGLNNNSLRQSWRYSMIGKRRAMFDYLARMNAAIAAARGPYGTQPAVTPSNPLSDALIVAPDQIRFKDAQNQAEDRLLETACALRAYKLDHGAYPSTLQALVPSYLHAVPRDPFTASSTLRYRLTGPTYVLYSIGPDMRDDGGKPATYTLADSERRYLVEPDSQGDIVAGVNL